MSDLIMFQKKAVLEQTIREALSQVIDPVLNVSIVDARLLKAIQLNGGAVSLQLIMPYFSEDDHTILKSAILTQLRGVTPEIEIAIEISTRIRSHKVQSELKPKPNIKNIIAVSSGKGGVGKSTVSINLALGLKTLGAKVALLDADIYGPSQPRMLGKHQVKAEARDKKFIPIESHGLQTMSMGYLVDEQAPMIWRGPMATQALQQLLNETDWASCDYLILDLPPGTGDIQLTMAQKIPLSGAVVVTTPQDIALADVYKAYRMFEKLDIPVLGVIENMSLFTCTHCQHTHTIFGEGGGSRLANEFGLELLAQLPLSSLIREKADNGEKLVDNKIDTLESSMFIKCAARVTQALAMRAVDYSTPIQNVKIVS